MTEIQRYTQWCGISHGHALGSDPCGQWVRYEDHAAALTSERSQREAAEREIRRALWLGHGHRGVYGDDGEMQCSECIAQPTRLWDYKNEPLERCVRAALGALRAERDSYRAQLTATGHVPYLDRMRELAAERNALTAALADVEREVRGMRLTLRLYENGTSPNQPLVDDIERWRVESEQRIAAAESQATAAREALNIIGARPCERCETPAYQCAQNADTLADYCMPCRARHALTAQAPSA